MYIYTVYDSPKDYPGKIVVRTWFADGESSEPKLTGHIAIFSKDLMGDAEALKMARSWLRSNGLAQISRNDEDEPTIVESWI